MSQTNLKSQLTNFRSRDPIRTATAKERCRPLIAPCLRAIVPSCLFLLCGCFRITIDPQCPDQIEVGQTGDLIAHEATPGGIPRYLWQADSAGRVAIANDDEPDTTFEALRAGQVIFTLMAADGFFQMIDTCTTTIVPAGGTNPEPDLSVNLIAAPAIIVIGVGDPSSLLTCTSTGTTPATLTIDQLDGPPAELTSVVPGISVAVFGNQAGTYTFRCVGADAQGNSSDPATVRVTLSPQTSP